MIQFNQGHALLVGVGQDLPITIKDATGLADFLKDPRFCAYPDKQVTLLTGEEATREKVLAAFDDLIGRTTDEDTVVIYFSGHGYVATLPLLGKTYFLMTNGYNLEKLTGTAISGQEFADKLRALAAKKILVLLDCCHAGGLDEAQTKAIGVGLSKSSMPPESAELLAEGSGYVFIGSSREDELSYAGKPYSVFTYALLEALGGTSVAKKDGYVRVTDISGYCQQVVPQRTRKEKYGPQHPVLNFAQADNFVVAYYAGGDSMPKTLTLPELEIEDPETAVQPAGTVFNQQGQRVENQTNIGSIGTVGQIGNVRQGGVNFDGDGSVSIGGDVVGGDQFNMSGDFRGANVNINSTLENVTQSIGASPHGDDTQKAEVERLIAELKSQLATVPQQFARESEKLADRLATLMEEAAEDEPDAAIIGKFGDRVKQTAGKIAVVLPTVLPLAQKIVAAVQKMIR